MLCESFMPKESLLPHTLLTAVTGLSVALRHQQTYTASIYCNYISTAAVSDPNLTPSPADKSIIDTNLPKSTVKSRPIPEPRLTVRPMSSPSSSTDKNLNQIPGLTKPKPRSEFR